MTRDDILIKIKPIFIKVLEHNNFELTDMTTTQDGDGWRSLTHMVIIDEIEKDFDINFKILELMGMDNIGDLINSIKYNLS